MQLTGLYWGNKLLRRVEYPHAEVLGPEASVDDIKDLIKRCGQVFIKPIFKGGVGKKGKAGLIGRAKDISTALKEKERLYFIEHTFGHTSVKADGVTFEGGVPAEHEVYFSISDSTLFRAPMMTITHHGGMDIEELPKDKIREIPFDPLTGLKSFHISNALTELGAPGEIISPLVQNLPKLWTLYNNYGMSMLELNPIRMMPDSKGRLTPVACDFKCSFDIDNPAWKRLDLPAHLFASDYSEFEQEINQLRTYQGQSDVFVINPKGTITAPTFGGGANALVTELLGERATISSDFGGNPPYEKMFQISRIVFKHWIRQSNVLFIIGGKANNTDIFETFRAMADALRDNFNTNGPTPLYVVIGRGGPNLIRGMAYMRDTLDNLKLPYRIFGHDSAMSEVVNYALNVDKWMEKDGRTQLAKAMGLEADTSAKAVAAAR
ncbi:MAG TPA: carboxylate--amine ligase [Deltaproteobacteria bacterium]|nr:MAG: carboxylate--amine ligase [Deltaproteobacteria bacterium GWA2_55_82]OGQ62480.1 MAG: carboxylate--amine ligase [Deltaproteobacteria bacterium RIFCSPLOWO2_02_FULL_55_12]OIJ73007.1 MAG: carboxylate--amine ligase [Deltaproteobacteria bacterium GWC2_55_46]HBG45983.1 carboxylate--amine ligase [Deltaproteobacteria bacterium]HCY11799.1 carboxylate--amine ligase [Deltaproteobacteria bacterium]